MNQKSLKTLLMLVLAAPVLALFYALPLYSQQNNVKTINPDKDTTQTKSGAKLIDIQSPTNSSGAADQKTTDTTLNVFQSFDFNNPTIKLFIAPGATTYNNNTYPGDYNSTTSVTIELGTISQKDYYNSFSDMMKIILNPSEPIEHNPLPIKNTVFSGVFFNYNFNNSNNPIELINTPTNKLGKTFSGGFVSLYGGTYNSTNLSLLNGSGFGWISLDLEHYPEASLTPITPTIADGTRFTNKYIAEISAFKFANTVSLNLSATRSVIYERHLFWKWSGSMLIKGIASNVLNVFLSDIRKNAPLTYPVVSFLLNGALDFGFSELQKKKMNWPFNTAPGYIHDEFRVGIGFEF